MDIASEGVRRDRGTSVLVAYASKHGSTAGIAEAIAERLREHGLDARARSVEEIDDPGAARAVVLGSAVYAGSWRKEAVGFAHRHAGSLSQRPVWLFSSGPLGTRDDRDEEPRQLAELTEVLHPIEHRVFPGSLDADALGFAERMVVKAVKAPEGDFRDWPAIRDWADEIASSLGEPASR
jgi:menaquinone-dependent protoporphyrinogen oxidase